MKNTLDNKKLNKEEIKNILDEKFPFFDNSGTSWEDADEISEDAYEFILYGSARHHYYKVNLNGKYYYSLRNGARGGLYFYLSREDALNNKECTKEDIIEDASIENKNVIEKDGYIISDEEVIFPDKRKAIQVHSEVFSSCSECVLKDNVCCDVHCEKGIFTFEK